MTLKFILKPDFNCCNSFALSSDKYTTKKSIFSFVIASENVYNVHNKIVYRIYYNIFWYRKIGLCNKNKKNV